MAFIHESHNLAGNDGFGKNAEDSVA